MNRYELIIFDWDGTLLDSAGEIVAAMQQAVASLGLEPRSDAQLRRMIGLGLQDAFFRLYPDLDAEAMEALLQSYRQLYGSTPRVYGEAFPGVANSLDDLRGRGMRLAVATGKSRRGLDRALTAVGWEQHFVATRCADETAGKPDPLMLEELLWELDLVAEQALMVGDTTYDMEMARRAGMDAVGVGWGVHERQELAQAGALTVLEGVTGLGDWLRE